MQQYERLEQEWATYNRLDPKGMVACASGTAALHLAVEALQLRKGGEIVVPDFTMYACARAVTLAGRTPAFVDCDPATLLMDLELCDQYTKHNDVRAVMAVHVYGRQLNMDWLTESAPRHDYLVIEDLAEAHTVRPHEKTDAACWSFYRNKIVHGEEGGAVWFKEPAHASLARQLRSLGFTDAHDFMHLPRGHNYRLSNVHAQLIGESLLNVWNETHARRKWEGIYNYHCPDEWRMPPRQAPWVYDIRIPGMTSDKQRVVVQTLNQMGIAARHAFKPMSLQEEFRHCTSFGNRNHTLTASSEVVYFPLVGLESTEQVQDCFNACRTVI